MFNYSTVIKKGIMNKFISTFLFTFMLSIQICYAQRYDSTSDYIFARYDKDNPTITDQRNVMRLTCVIDEYNKVITEYQLAIAYNSPDKSVIKQGQKMTMLLYNNKTLTFYSQNDITAEDNVSYKERVKTRYKCYLVYRLTLEDMNEILKNGVFELKMAVGEGKITRYSVRNVPVWQFDEVIKRQFDELQKNQRYSATSKKTKKSKDKNKEAKPETDVNLLYKEGRISYLEGDSLVKTDENIKFDVKWIE